jgi:hypothetical protein
MSSLSCVPTLTMRSFITGLPLPTLRSPAAFVSAASISAWVPPNDSVMNCM